MAVQVSRSRHGYLALRIFWRGRDEWVGTKLRDDGEGGKNHRRLEAKAILVSERLEAGDERRLGIRQRVFYCTRDTSISWQLTQGANPWGVAKYHGTSLQMIERHYGKYIPDRGLDPRNYRGSRAPNRNLDRNLWEQKAKVSCNSSKVLVQIKCEEGDLNPQKSNWLKRSNRVILQ